MPGTERYWSNCVYTIKHSDDIEQYSRSQASISVDTGEKRWTTASQFVAEASTVGKTVLVLFATAEKESGVVAIADLTSVEVGDRNRFTFKNLRKLKTPLPKSQLVLRDGTNLSEDYIRDYAICVTPPNLGNHPAFDLTPLLAPGLPPPAAKWTGFAKYNFVGGHNDPEHLPLEGLLAAANAVLEREGRTLATYGLESGPLGYRPLRQFLARKLEAHAGIDCEVDEILITSGSLQAIDLINTLFLARGDTVLIEQASYGGSLARLARRGVNAVGVPLDGEGMRTDALASALADLERRSVRAKYIYTIPTVQNPTGTIMGERRRGELLELSRRYAVPIFEDECYSDLVWTGARPPALYAMAGGEGIVHIGSFSKSVSPALRVGYIVARWDILSRILPLKTDAGSGALEQMVLGEFCPAHFEAHVPKLRRGLRAKLETLMEALAEQFGTSAEFDDPAGGIYLWVKLPDSVDAQRLAQAALADGIAINPGPEWTTDKAYGGSRLRLCFAHPSHDTIRHGVAALAEVCRREFGVPARIANVERG